MATTCLFFPSLTLVFVCVLLFPIFTPSSSSSSSSKCSDHFNDDAHIEAIIENNLELAKCFINKSPSIINYQDPSRGWNALHVSCHKVSVYKYIYACNMLVSNFMYVYECL